MSEDRKIKSIKKRWIKIRPRYLHKFQGSIKDWCAENEVEIFQKEDQRKPDGAAYEEDNSFYIAPLIKFDNFEVIQPDLMMIYLGKANESVINSILLKANIKNGNDSNSNSNFIVFAEFIKEITTAIILISSAIEGFINKQIPEDYKHLKNTKKSTETFDKFQIERWLNTEEKIDIVEKIKNFNLNSSQKSTIKNLMEIRNKIVHLKTNEDDTSFEYEKIYKELYQYDISYTLSEIIKIFNFVEKDYIKYIENENEYQVIDNLRTFIAKGKLF